MILTSLGQEVFALLVYMLPSIVGTDFEALTRHCSVSKVICACLGAVLG